MNYCSKIKIIYLLIGPKGSGKSFIGVMMEKEFGIKFVRVEDRVKEIRRGRQINDHSYLKEAFEVIENFIREFLNDNDKIVFESTGLTIYFDRMLKDLRRDFSVVTIGIRANDDLCLNRVKTRDLSIHINVSDDEVNEINKQVKEKQIKTDFTLINENKSAGELTKEIAEIIKTITG